MIYDTIISYSTIDDLFIRENIRQSLYFSKEIYITICSNFYDGKSEDETKIKELKEYCRQFPNVHIIRFKWEEGKDARYWHNYARWLGFQQCDTEFVMFMDSDEIFEGELLVQSLENDKELYTQYDEYVFSCYWYFREPRFRAKNLSQCHKLIRSSILTKDIMFSENELGAIGFSGKFKCLHEITFNMRPILHHFSWVRTKEEMIRKTSSWGHKNDKNWKDLIEEEFSRDFNDTDFVWGYEYDIVEAPFKFEKDFE